MIDAHVHLRDQGLASKETIAHGLATAKRCGITRVFDMPNTKPVLTTREAVLDRLSLAGESVKKTRVSYHIHMGLTKDPEQIREAVATHAMLFPLVIGLKMFLGNSTGNMGIVTADGTMDTDINMDVSAVVMVVLLDELIRTDRRITWLPKPIICTQTLSISRTMSPPPGRRCP